MGTEPRRIGSRLEFLVSFILIVAGYGLPAAAQDGRTRNAHAVDEQLRRITANAETIRQQTAALREPATKARAGTSHENGRDRRPRDIGLCSSENFSVMCRASELDSRVVLAKAEELREQIAVEWLGAELPEGAGFALIHVRLSDSVDEGLTLLVDRPEQGHHRIWLTTTKERATGTALAHELAHVVLRAGLPQGLPAWANEGLASSYDDGQRKSRRTDILASLVKANQWPAIVDILEQERISPADEQAYALAASLTDFFRSLGNRQEFVQFVQEGSREGWDGALKTVYGIADSSELQERWQAWVRQNLGRTLAMPHRQGLAKS